MGGKYCLRCKSKTLLGVVSKLLKAKKNIDITQQCFALLPQVNYPANNLNFYWRRRWLDWIQAIFLNLLLLHITLCPHWFHWFSGLPTALHTEGGAFAGCKTNLKPRNIFLHSFKRIWQAESKNSKWLGVISTNYTKKSRVWLRIYSSVYNTKTRMPCRPGGIYWDSWDFSQPNFAENEGKMWKNVLCDSFAPFLRYWLFWSYWS